VLLKLALTWATPLVMFLRSRRLIRWGAWAIWCLPVLIPEEESFASTRSSRACRRIEGLLLLAGDRLGLALAGAGVGVGALAADRQALAVAQAAVAGEVHQPLDVHRGLADLQHFGVAEVLHAAALVDAELGGDLLGRRRPNSMDIGKRDNHALVGR